MLHICIYIYTHFENSLSSPKASKKKKKKQFHNFLESQEFSQNKAQSKINYTSVVLVFG